IGQGDTRKTHTDAGSTTLETSSLVPFTDPIVDCTSDSVKTTRSNFTSDADSSPLLEPKIESPRVQALRTRYEKKGFSQKTINLFISAMDTNSSRTMSSNLRTWISWCLEQSEDPVVCLIN